MPEEPGSRINTPAGNPRPESVRMLRERVQAARGLDITRAQDQCAEALHTSRRAWQQWERGDRRMHPAFWELACDKAAEIEAEAATSKAMAEAMRALRDDYGFEPAGGTDEAPFISSGTVPDGEYYFGDGFKTLFWVRDDKVIVEAFDADLFRRP